MKRVLIILFLVSLLSGCGTKEVPVAVTEEVETPVEPLKLDQTYELTIVKKESYLTALCTITSRIKNIDSVKHRYAMNSYVLINNVKEGLIEEFNLMPSEIRVVARDIKCPSGTEDTMNVEVAQKM